MKTQSFVLSAASMFLAAACGGSGSTPAESTMPASEAAPAAEGMHGDGMHGDGAAAAGAMPTPTGDQVKCMGINACKGQAACSSPSSHSCAGQNECKGKGWVLSASSTDCTAKGGTVTEG